MRRFFFLLLSFSCVSFLYAQKKPLDHTVYDSWQSIGEKLISNDGKWVAYTVNPQEGNNELVIQATGIPYKKTIPRGYDALITEDSRFLICKIRPLYTDTRDARIKKKKPEDMPRDSLLLIELGIDNVWKMARVKTYKTPAKSYGWLAYHLEKPIEQTGKGRTADGKKLTDSLNRIIDSLKEVIQSIPRAKEKMNDEENLFTALADADGDEATGPQTAGTASDLVLRKLATGEQQVFKNVLEYYFSKNGTKLLIESTSNPRDSIGKMLVLLFDLRKGFADTISRGGNEFKNFVITDDGQQVAYIAERDAKPKELQKFYKVWYHKEGMDTALIVADKNSVGMKIGMTISEHGVLNFSKNGKRLFFGTTPIQAPKDTSLIDIDLVKLDIWHYKEDYLQSQQLFRLQRDLQTNFLAVVHLENRSIKQLGSEEIPLVYQTDEGNGDRFVGITDFGKRVEGQWLGNTRKDIYAIDVTTGIKKLVKKDLLGVLLPTYLSPSGRYIMWYDSKAKNYFTWDGDSTRNITAKIKLPLYNEEYDSPGDPPPYGPMKWQEDEEAVYVYDRYDIWKLSPSGSKAPSIFTQGRKAKTQYRYVQTIKEERFLKNRQALLLKSFNEANKNSGLWECRLNSTNNANRLYALVAEYNMLNGTAFKATARDQYLFTRESFKQSPDLYTINGIDSTLFKDEINSSLENVVSETRITSNLVRLSSINPQQKNYNWGTAELYKWKTFTGKTSEGILYKPEDFNPAKKYPLILYFYEKLSDMLNNYQAPSPTPSRLNISFYTSRGYLVFTPDISYTIGHPAKSAYDYIVSAAKDLTKNKWVDAKNIGIQGQSWGGIQVAQLVTMTDMFKAAWAGAPVANMTSAYGGIRWESGANRQFQYEKTQSRIGATLWEKPELYIENSPLFQLPNVKTPLVIMSNDADGAVPWYQGIELFTAMRRLGKKVWMLNYNGEAHNLVQRKNRKDIQIRQQQFFDWLLKGEKPAKWITEGVPAVKKGKDWGLELVD